MSKRTYYIVEVTCREMRAYDGSIVTKEDSKAYLGWSHEGGGWPSIDREKKYAKQFDHIPTKKEISQWDGMPWYYVIKTAKVIPVEEVKIHTITEGEAISV